MTKTMRIGSGSAWWGDRIEPAALNAEKGPLDDLCFETMAEATISAAQVLTADRVKAFYNGAITGEVLRYPVDGLHAINFVAHGALGGGVSRSLSLDQDGKAMSAALLGFQIDVPDALRSRLRNYQNA